MDEHDRRTELAKAANERERIAALQTQGAELAELERRLDEQERRRDARDFARQTGPYGRPVPAPPLSMQQRRDAIAGELDLAIAQGADPADLRDLADALSILTYLAPSVATSPDPTAAELQEARRQLGLLRLDAARVTNAARELGPARDLLREGRLADLGDAIERLAAELTDQAAEQRAT